MSISPGSATPFSKNRPVPQRPQKRRFEMPLELHSTGSPVIATRSALNAAQPTAGAPAWRRQSRQWQSALCSGSPVASYRTAPQAHPPVHAIVPPPCVLGSFL